MKRGKAHAYVTELSRGDAAIGWLIEVYVGSSVHLRRIGPCSPAVSRDAARRFASEVIAELGGDVA